MTRVLVLGATGRTGSAIITEFSADCEVIAAVRTRTDSDRLPRGAQELATRVVDIGDPASIRTAADDVEVVVNAIRLREDIDPDALVRLHEGIQAAAPDAWTVTVGGAGSLHLPGGRRFWEHPGFPPRTLPRGIAHARLRDHLESGAAGARWTYLIPPPAFDPDGPRTACVSTTGPSADESVFAATGSISYADFAISAAHQATSPTPGTLLIHEA
ncbi:MAG TPA: NAD(P)H-binding protein [Ruania sp.]|nr:NAD(P)H-binding protein [Ruania sp.]